MVHIELTSTCLLAPVLHRNGDLDDREIEVEVPQVGEGKKNLFGSEKGARGPRQYARLVRTVLD